MKRINKETKQKIKELSLKGNTQVQIADELGICQGTVSYWLIDEKMREKRRKRTYQSFKSKPLEERRKIYKSRLGYLREWQKKKYWSDEDFRNMKKDKARSRYKKKEKKDV